MTAIAFTKFVSTSLAATAIGLGALMTVGAPLAHASEKSDCEGKGGTYSETTITDNKTGKIGTRYSCCVKDAATKTTTCTSTTVTKASQIPVDIGPGVIVADETTQPVVPTTRVPLHVANTGAQIESAP